VDTRTSGAVAAFHRQNGVTDGYGREQVVGTGGLLVMVLISVWTMWM
jgi:hypothetical protein